MSKPKVAFYWCASCGGCEEAVVDLHEQILDVVAAVDIVFWPVALDFKREDVEKLADGELTASFVNGSVRNSEQQEMVELLRRKSKLLIAFGACAQLGGIPALANLHDAQSILERVYQEAPSVENPERTRPSESMELPRLWNRVQPLGEVVLVDYTLPGCPPPPALLMKAIQALLSGDLPAPGSILAPNHALCDECPRKETKPSDLALKELKRPHRHPIDPEKCLLAQGFLCLGMATRAGCDSRCIRATMPCTGCLGPTDQVRDQGAKAMSAVASLIGSNDAEEIARILDGVVDPVGTFYRYGLGNAIGGKQ